MKIFLLIVKIMLIALYANAQFVPEFAQQLKALEFINPGYLALKENPSVQLLFGNNYTNTEGANGLFAVNLNMPVPSLHIGLGSTFLHEQYGEIGMSYCTFKTSVEVKVLKTTYLTFGLGVGIEATENIESTASNEIHTSVLQTNFYSSTGINLFSENLHAGLAMHYTQLTKDIFIEDEYFTYFLNGSYTIALDETTSIKPTMMCRYHVGKSRCETGLFADYSNIIETGISYRSDQSLIFFAELLFFKRLTFGFCYLYNFNEFDYLSDGLREFRVGFKML